MSDESTRTVNRGRRSTTAVWIVKRQRDRSATYCIRWIDPQTGRTLTESCGRDKALARLRRDAKKSDLRDGLSGRLPDKSVSDLKFDLERFMVGKSRHTVRKTRDSLKNLIDLCGDRRLEHVDRGMVMDFRAKRMASGVAVATVNKDLRQLKSAMTYATEAGWLRSNPLWRWKAMQLREPEKRIRVIEPAEFAKLASEKNCPNLAFRALLLVGYYQGLRRTEMVNLRWSAVDFEACILRVENRPEHEEFTKSRKNRTLPMLPPVRDILAKLLVQAPKVVEAGGVRPKRPHCFIWADGDPFKADWVTHNFATLVKAAGIADCTVHDLRRSFSTLAQRAGVDKAVVKDLGGWSTIGVVEKHYSGEAPEVFKRAMERIAAAQGVA